MKSKQYCIWKIVLTVIFLVGGPSEIMARSASDILIADVGVWDNASNGARQGVFLLIADGKIVASGATMPDAPEGARSIDGTGLFVLGDVSTGTKANFVVLDANPAEDISVVADTAAHVKLVFVNGSLLKDELVQKKNAATIEEDTFHVPLRAIIANRDWGSIGFAGIITIDGIGVHQDEAGVQQVGEIERTQNGVSGVRFGIFGHLGRKSPITYFTDIGYNGFEEGFDVQNNDEYSLYNLEIGIPRTPIGSFTVGRMKPPGSISRVWPGAYLPMTARPAPVSALTKSRDDGIRLTNTAFDKRMTWSVSLANDWLTEDVSSMSDASSYVTGRITSLLLNDTADDRLLHVGLTARYSDFANETIRFRAKPGIPFVENFVDTGDMRGDAARWLTGDIAYRKGPLMISGEYIRTDLDSPTIGDPTFTGSYVWAEWTLTGETRAYNADKATFGRLLPTRDFSKGGRGLWSLVASVSDTDLNEGTIEGGDMQQVILGVNWYPQKSFRWGVAFSRIWLDRLGLQSETNYAHMFFHVSNL